MPVAGGLMNFFDAVHGRIELVDPATGDSGIIRLLGSPMMDRMRRIKLLGYASHIYPAADHSRYAHALGTMQVMRRLLRQASLQKDMWLQTKDALAQFGDPPIENHHQLAQHMLVAALLQDVGELPYSQATARFLRPSDDVRHSVRTSTGMDPSGWTGKDVFTTVSLQKEKTVSQSGLNSLFLVFLITGHCKLGSGEHVPASLKALRHMLDGEVDSDRLDYVYRDAHHTVGGRGTPQAVIDSLLYYDEFGPVFSDPGPVSEFVTTRIALYTKVYFSAENRFRIVLLSTLIRGIIERESEFKELMQRQTWSNGLTFHEFQKLDDIWLIAFIQRLGSDRELADRLNPRAKKALDILLDNSDYDCYWVKPGAADGPEPIPDSLFFDTYSYHEEGFCACAKQSIRIKSGRYDLIGNPIGLEDCCGPFKTLFGSSDPIERPESVLMFKPMDLDPSAWRRIKSAIEEGRLYSSLQDADPFSPLPVESDTRRAAGFKGPTIFISFCWDDAAVVGRLLAALHYRRRRYYVLNDPFHRTGDEPGRTSVEAATHAEAVIILFSEAYLRRYLDQPNGFIAREIKVIGRRREGEGVPLATLTTCPFSTIRDRIPYDMLGLREPPNVGDPLANAADSVIERAIDGVLQNFDTEVRGEK